MKSLKQVWAAAQRNPSKKKKARISEEPEATIEIPEYYERISAKTAEILLLPYQNRNCRLRLRSDSC